MGLETVNIRRAEIGDLPVIQNIYNDAISETTALLEYEPYSDEYMCDWFEKKQVCGFPVFIASQGGIAMGFSSYGHFRQRPGYLYTVESTVYLDKQYRGKGIGRLLMAALIAEAKKQELHIIIACIESTNQASIKLHEQMSFRKAAEFKEVGFKFNRWITLFFYQLILNASLTAATNMPSDQL